MTTQAKDNTVIEMPSDFEVLTEAQQQAVNDIYSISNSTEGVRTFLKGGLDDDNEVINHGDIIAVAQYLKAHAIWVGSVCAKLNSFKSNFSIVAKDMELNLSLQKCGKKATCIIAEKQPQKGEGNKKKGEADNADVDVTVAFEDDFTDADVKTQKISLILLINKLKDKKLKNKLLKQFEKVDIELTESLEELNK